MDPIYRNLQSTETLKKEWNSQNISIMPVRRCIYDKVTGEKIPGKYEYHKHQDGTQKYFGVSDDQKNFCAVCKALAKDLETAGAPDPKKVVIVQEVSQDGGQTWVKSLMYQGGNQEATFVF